MVVLQKWFSNFRRRLRIPLRKREINEGKTEERKQLEALDIGTSLKDEPQSTVTASDATAASPLFQLPREIRDQIWGYLVAEYPIHIVNPTSRRITHIICQVLAFDISAPHTDMYNAKQICAGNIMRKRLHATQPQLVCWRFSDKAPFQGVRLNHRKGCFKKCRALPDTTLSYDDHDYREVVERAQLSLAAMRTCRAVYDEMSWLLWTRNLFMFARSKSFRTFLDSRTQVQRDWIRHIVLRPIRPLCFASVPNTHSPLPDNPWLYQDTAWSEALQHLPNLVSAYLTAKFHMTLEDVAAMWCSRELVDKTGNTASFDIIDQLATKSTLRAFYPLIADIEVWCTNPWNPKGYYGRSGDETLKTLLEAVLRKRVTGRVDLEWEREDTDSRDANESTSTEDDRKQLEQKRRRSFEEYANKVLMLPWRVTSGTS